MSVASGFYWGANNPYLKTVWVKVRRAPRGLNPSIALIETAPGLFDANPAHIIYECMTNRDWGMGGGLGLFNRTSFEIAAQTLFNEKFGLSMIWTRSATIEAFVTEVVDHIHAALYVNPRTGLWDLKLLREDFDIDSLRVITPDNAKLTNFQRKLWGETANEIVVTYTDPATEGESTIAAQDIANVAMQGGVVSNGRNYYGIRSKDLAARVAERDLRAVAQPLATCDIELDRRFWDLVPGEVVALHWPEKGIERLVVRVGVVNYGQVDQSVIKTNLYEDIFSMAAASYLSPPDTEWENPSAPPQPLTEVLIHTAPAFITNAALDAAELQAIAYPEVVSMVLAAPNASSDLNFELIGEVTKSTGAVVWTSFGSRDFVGSARLASALTAEAETTITAFAGATGASPLAGSLVFIGDVSEQAHEIALVKEVTEDGWVLSRGVLDTTPKPWATGTRLWSVPADRVFIDTTLRSAGEEVDYRLLAQTSGGLLAFDDAPSETVVLTGRPHLPNRPADVKASGVGFGAVAATGSSIPITWANRNRLMETTQILPWNAGTVAPEAGQTTTVYALKTDGSVLATYNGLTGTFFDLPVSAFGGQSSGRIRVTSRRDGLESLQGHEIIISGFTSNSLGLSGETGALLLSGDAQSGADKLLLGAE